jgi:hypothetical protein
MVDKAHPEVPSALAAQEDFCGESGCTLNFELAVAKYLAASVSERAV